MVIYILDSKIKTGKLSKHFIERPPNDELKFALTDYAKELIELIDKKLHSLLKNFPLKKTFKKFTKFKAAKIKILEDFEIWHRLEFSTAGKHTIIDHLEALKYVVKTSINRLNNLLKAESEDLVTLTKEFANARHF
ncbi:MAG: hypothetical protein ACK5H1_05965 [Tenacibaculum sp.]